MHLFYCPESRPSEVFPHTKLLELKLARKPWDPSSCEYRALPIASKPRVLLLRSLIPTRNSVPLYNPKCSFSISWFSGSSLPSTDNSPQALFNHHSLTPWTLTPPKNTSPLLSKCYVNITSSQDLKCLQSINPHTSVPKSSHIPGLFTP